jgi:hypothetical protein
MALDADARWTLATGGANGIGQVMPSAFRTLYGWQVTPRSAPILRIDEQVTSHGECQ